MISCQYHQISGQFLSRFRMRPWSLREILSSLFVRFLRPSNAATWLLFLCFWWAHRLGKRFSHYYLTKPYPLKTDLFPKIIGQSFVGVSVYFRSIWTNKQLTFCAKNWKRNPFIKAYDWRFKIDQFATDEINMKWGSNFKEVFNICGGEN